MSAEPGSRALIGGRIRLPARARWRGRADDCDNRIKGVCQSIRRSTMSLPSIRIALGLLLVSALAACQGDAPLTEPDAAAPSFETMSLAVDTWTGKTTKPTHGASMQ